MQPRWFSSSPDLILFVLQDILDEMRKELSKLKEELIDGKAHTAGHPAERPAEPSYVRLHIKTTFLFSLNTDINKPHEDSVSV